MVIARSRTDVGRVLFKTCGNKSLMSLLCTKPGSCHRWVKHISDNSEEAMKELIVIFVCNITQLMKLQSVPVKSLLPNLKFVATFSIVHASNESEHPCLI